MEPHCPRCRQDIVQRIRRQGLLEYLLSIAYIYPFRCQVCSHRFRTFQWGVRYVKQALEKRQQDRLVTRFQITFSGNGIDGSGMVTLVSLGGCAIETDTKLSSGQILQLQLKPSDRDPAVAVDAAVVRGIRSPLVGLQFLRFRMEERERLSQFVRGFRATQPQR
ncbi:MAG: PilZ domain-containing protein [Candidatus Methylomirabilales bacterium]